MALGFAMSYLWGDAGVDDRDGLENRCRRQSTVGSNPTLPVSERGFVSDHQRGAPLYHPLRCFELKMESVGGRANNR